MTYSPSNLPLVSIIIPFYNNPHTINETIESCLDSTYRNIEVIIVNDGSNFHLENIIKPEFINCIKIIDKKMVVLALLVIVEYSIHKVNIFYLLMQMI